MKAGIITSDGRGLGSVLSGFVALLITLAVCGFASVADADYFLTSSQDGNIYKTEAGTTTVFIASTEPNLAASTGPKGMVLDSQNRLYVVSSGDFGSKGPRILRYNALTGAFIDVFAASGQSFRMWEWATLDSAGNLYYAGWNNDGIGKVTPSGTLDMFFAPTSGSLHDLIVGADGNLWAGHSNQHTVRRYNITTGAYIDDVIPYPGDAYQWGPRGLEIVGGELFWVEWNQHRVIRYNYSTGASNGYLTTSLFYPNGIELGPDGLLYVDDTNNNRVVSFKTDGTLVATYSITTPFDTVFVSTPVPEPSSVALIVLGASGLFACRRQTAR